MVNPHSVPQGPVSSQMSDFGAQAFSQQKKCKKALVLLDDILSKPLPCEVRVYLAGKKDQVKQRIFHIEPRIRSLQALVKKSGQ
jgi:hypothetical protein